MSRGVNAYIAEALRNPASLPIEFKSPRHQAGALDDRGRHLAAQRLLSNLGEEVKMAQAVRVLGADKVKDLEDFPGPDPNLTPDPAVDLSLINKSILELYDAFRTPLRFGGSPRGRRER